MSHRFQCKRKRETANAVLVVDVESGEEVWLPFSQIESMHFDKSEQGEIVISDWLAKTKGLA